MDLIIITLVTSIILIYISWMFSKKNSSFQYAVPLIVAILSIITIALSFIVGRWSGMGIGVIGLTFLIASIIALVVTSFLSFREIN
ncbi:YesK family protein [Planococcus chinensis]|uniref:YesK family protein n=1 Tax=Planococcus chinensis TaxID=272917 RepID=A0ABW4QIV1_9BACL